MVSRVFVVSSVLVINIHMQFFCFCFFAFLLSAAPKFTKIPTDQIGVSGGVASFVCQATGNPKPVVYWNKKGKKVNSQRIEVVVTVRNVKVDRLMHGMHHFGKEFRF